MHRPLSHPGVGEEAMYSNDRGRDLPNDSRLPLPLPLLHAALVEADLPT